MPFFRISASAFVVALAAGLAVSSAALAQAQQQQYPPFDAVDADNDGQISFVEMQATFPAVTEEVFAAGDIDGSGGLSPDEYGAMTGQ